MMNEGAVMTDIMKTRLGVIADQLSSMGYSMSLDADAADAVDAGDLYAAATKLENLIAVLLMTASQIENGVH